MCRRERIRPTKLWTKTVAVSSPDSATSADFCYGISSDTPRRVHFSDVVEVRTFDDQEVIEQLELCYLSLPRSLRHRYDRYLRHRRHPSHHPVETSAQCFDMSNSDDDDGTTDVCHSHSMTSSASPVTPATLRPSVHHGPESTTSSVGNSAAQSLLHQGLDTSDQSGARGDTQALVGEDKF